MLQVRTILKISTVFLSGRLKGKEHLRDRGLYVGNIKMRLKYQNVLNK